MQSQFIAISVCACVISISILSFLSVAPSLYILHYLLHVDQVFVLITECN